MDEKNKCSCAEVQPEPTAQEVDVALKGLDYLTRLTYACIDRADMSYTEKRNLLFGVYSFRCMLEPSELHRASKTLVKYGCSFITYDNSVAEKPHVYNLATVENTTAYKFDAGSPLWQDKVRAGEITGDNATVPEKPTLYELALSVVNMSSATAELKAMWFVYFPYVFMVGAPIEYDLYDALKDKVHTAEVFSAANNGRYADNICCTAAELNGEDPMIADWYRPFVEWKCEKNEKGVSRETAKYQRALALGDYEYAMQGTEKLLDSFPDDEEILLLNISARTSLAPGVDFERRVKLLSSTYAMINEAFKQPLKKYTYFLYYRALTRLGMADPEGAEVDFRACIETDPKFEPALMMLKGIENAKNKAENEPLKS